MRKVFLMMLLSAACLSTATQAEDNWPRFRGSNAVGVAPDNTGLPMTWTTAKNVKWVAAVPGWGWSCPIVWGDRVFLTAVVSDQKNRVPSKGLDDASATLPCGWTQWGQWLRPSRFIGH
jgi:hypothetical protein